MTALETNAESQKNPPDLPLMTSAARRIYLPPPGYAMPAPAWFTFQAAYKLGSLRMKDLIHSTFR